MADKKKPVLDEKTVPAGASPESKGASARRYPGRPLQVVKVEVVESGDAKDEATKPRRVVVDKKALGVLLANIKRTGVRKLAMVSIVGAMRTGKSFMLDLFLRYLTEPQGNLDKDPQAFLKNTNMTAEREGLFYWRAHEQRQTTGIWFYSHPFVRTVGGERVAVLLMDTQGLFDPESPQDINKAIFGLSVLLSSYQILNVQNRIQENTLQELHYFTEFAHTAIRQFVTGEVDDEGDDGKRAPGDRRRSSTEFDNKFQRLEFLVRDWANFDSEDPEENVRQAQALLEKTFKKRYDDKGTRDRIQASFESVDAFFLPHPGKKMANKRWSGDMAVVDAEFKEMVSVYLNRLFGVNLSVKKDLLQGKTLNPSSFEYYVTEFTKVFQGDALPEAETLVQAMTRATTLDASNRALKRYRSIMDKVAGPNSSYVRPGALQVKNEAAMERARGAFRRVASFGDKKKRQEAMEEVEVELEKEFGRYKEANRNRVDKILAQYAVLGVVAVVAFMLDTASDYTCDWWSDTCKEGSRLMKYVYTLAALIIGAQVALLYRSVGQIVRLKALGGLWAEGTRIAVEYWGMVSKATARARAILLQCPKLPARFDWVAGEAGVLGGRKRPRKSNRRRCTQCAQQASVLAMILTAPSRRHNSLKKLSLCANCVAEGARVPLVAKRKGEVARKNTLSRRSDESMGECVDCVCYACVCVCVCVCVTCVCVCCTPLQQQ